MGRSAGLFVYSHPQADLRLLTEKLICDFLRKRIGLSKHQSEY